MNGKQKKALKNLYFWLLVEVPKDQFRHAMSH